MAASSTLARLQQALTLWVLVSAAVWAAAWWGYAPSVAFLGAVGMLMGYSAVLALEFIILWRLGRSDEAPAASLVELFQAWAGETIMAARVFAWRQPFRWSAVADQGPQASAAAPSGAHTHDLRGVVLVHGFVCNRGFWTPWLLRLARQHRPFTALNLEPVFGSIDDLAGHLGVAVRAMRAATGRPPVLVCHSMGGLVARAWLADPRHSEEVAHVITIGSPHRGTWLAHFSSTQNGRQMRPGNRWLQALESAWRPDLAARFTCWWSNADNIVMPPSTATLPGAHNRMIRGRGHVHLAFDEQVMSQSLALIVQLDDPTASLR